MTSLISGYYGINWGMCSNSLFDTERAAAQTLTATEQVLSNRRQWPNTLKHMTGQCKWKLKVALR